MTKITWTQESKNAGISMLRQGWIQWLKSHPFVTSAFSMLAPFSSSFFPTKVFSQTLEWERMTPSYSQTWISLPVCYVQCWTNHCTQGNAKLTGPALVGQVGKDHPHPSMGMERGGERAVFPWGKPWCHCEGKSEWKLDKENNRWLPVPGLSPLF